MIPRKETIERVLLISGHVYFILLVLMAAYFYQERLMNFDSAQYVFQILQRNEFVIHHDRYVSYLTQWIPLLGHAKNWELKTILVFYSGALMLINYLVFILIAHGVKNIYAAILLVFVFGSTYREKFYAGISEIIPAIAFGILFIALFTRERKDKEKSNQWDYLLYPLAGILMAISHPVPILPVLGAYVFWIFYKNEQWNGSNWVKMVLYIFPMIIKFFSIQNNSYESEKLDYLEMAIPVLTNPGEFYVYSIMRNYIVHEHWFAWSIFLVSIIYLLIKKKFIPSVLLLGTALAVIVLNLITFHYLKHGCFIMIDGYMIFLAIPLGFAACMILLKKDKIRRWLAPTLLILFCFNLARIYHSRKFFSERIELLQSTYEAYADDLHKILITYPHHTDWGKIWYPYNYEAEVALHSTVSKGRNHTVTLIMDDNFCADIENMNRLSLVEKVQYLDKMKYFNPVKYPEAYLYLPKNTRAISVTKPAWISEKKRIELENWLDSKYGNRVIQD
jgi:hypothetical protein